MTNGNDLREANWGPVAGIPNVKRASGVAANERMARNEITAEAMEADNRRDERIRTTPQPPKQSTSLR